MALPPTSQPESTAARRHAPSFTLGLAAVLMALNAFALGASGSISALAGLTLATLAMLAIAASAYASRWRTALPGVDDTTAEAMALLVQSGLAMASALFVGVIAVVGIFDPRMIGGGAWAFVAVGLALGIGIAGVALKRHRGIDTVFNATSYADLVPALVVMIGVAAGTMLRAPGLDAAAALVVAVWLFWGALSPITSAARLLSRV